MPAAGAHQLTFLSPRGPAKALQQRAREAREFIFSQYWGLAASLERCKGKGVKVPRTTKKSCPKTLKRPQTTFLAPSFHMFVSVDSVEKITICSSITKCQKSASHPKDLSNATTAPRSFK